MVEGAGGSRNVGQALTGATGRGGEMAIRQRWNASRIGQGDDSTLAHTVVSRESEGGPTWSLGRWDVRGRWFRRLARCG